MERLKYSQNFRGGLRTVLAPEILGSDQYVYMLNCDVMSTDEGNMGKVTNLRGNVSIDVNLPSGENITIFSLNNEKSGKIYYAVWNSKGYHSWFELDYNSKTVTLIMQCITDTGNEDIWKWPKGVLINSANIVGGNLLYWTMEGQPARKINIKKATDKSFDDGYGNVILDEYTRAYKRAPDYAPIPNYFTDSSKKSNRIFRKLFKFASRFIYDDKEVSSFSDFSVVAVPEEEDVTGTKGVPLINNGIKVRFPTGGMIVKKIELIVKTTTDTKNIFSDWVSIGVFDKEILGIGDNTEYEYSFYNDTTYLSIAQEDVNQQQSDLPDNPLVQEFTYNTIVYGNYQDGFPNVKVDLDFQVKYSELFIPSGHEDVLNNPSIIFNLIEHKEEKRFLSVWRHTIGEIIIGPDVRSGNIFNVNFTNTNFSKMIKASLTDSAQTIASYFRTQFSYHSNMNSGGGYVENVVPAGGGAYKFKFRIWNNDRKPFIGVQVSSVPVNYSKLKDTGNSVPNEKLGSSRRYGIMYKSIDGKRSLTYGTENAVAISTINDLGGIKKVEVVMEVKHKAPSWAHRYSVMATENLNPDYIQILIQRVSRAIDSDGGEYEDLIIGSLSTFLKVHPNSTLGYEFKKGDRVRLVKSFSNNQWSIPSDVIDYEVLDYMKEYRYTVNENVIIDGTLNIKINGTPDSNNIGNNIVVDGVERNIVNVSSDGYILDSILTIDGASSSSAKTYPSYDIVNRNGILRIKSNPEYPIEVNPSLNKFALVEVFTPGKSALNAEHENYYCTGYDFEIYEDNGVRYHRGNFQDQTGSSSAKIVIGGFDNFVRNRELMTSNSEKNPQSIITSIEDSSYSDFYNSNLSSLGRPSRLDDSRGVVKLEDSLTWSNRYIEDTNINGLNMFLSTNRSDYNDKYGDIKKILFYEGKLYVFKDLKTGWVPVLGNLIVDSEGQSFVGISSRLLPNKMEYFLWEGGVGNNPESIVKYGNSVFFVSPSSQAIMEIGGSGAIPTSKQYGIDNYAREIIVSANASGAHIYGGINRKKNQYIIMVAPYDKISYNESLNVSNMAIVDIGGGGSWVVVSEPQNGTIDISGDGLNYSPDFNFSGIDLMSYRSINGQVRNISIHVLSEESEIVWHPDGEYCVMSGASRTGFVAYSMLNEFDVISGSYTGITKPNVASDVDYIAPFEDQVKCPLGSSSFVQVGVLNRSINNQTITFSAVVDPISPSDEDYNIIIKNSSNFEIGDIIAQTGLVKSGTYHDVVIDRDVSGPAYIFLSVPSGDYSIVKEFYLRNCYLISFNANSLLGIKSLSIDLSNIPISHGNEFNSLSISLCAALEVLVVKGHRIRSVDLSSNPVIRFIDLSKGYDIIGLTIANWNSVRHLDVSECYFTSDSYASTFINNVIRTFNSVVPNGSSGYFLKYGANNSLGVRPSASVRIDYERLISKGVTVIGREPIASSSVELFLDFVDIGQGVMVTCYVTNVLSTDITVTFNGSYIGVDDQVIYPIFDAMVISAGMFSGTKRVNFIMNGTDIGIAVTRVDPNPANGVIINF